MYVHGTELHVLLGNWQIVYGIPTYGMIYDRRYPMRPTAAKGFDLYFEPSEAVVRQAQQCLGYALCQHEGRTRDRHEPLAGVGGPSVRPQLRSMITISATAVYRMVGSTASCVPPAEA